MTEQTNESTLTLEQMAPVTGGRLIDFIRLRPVLRGSVLRQGRS